MKTLAHGLCALVAACVLATTQPAWAQFNRTSAGVSGSSPRSSSILANSNSMFGSRSFSGQSSSGSRSYLTRGQSANTRQPGQFVGADTRDIQNFRSMMSNPQQAQQSVQQWRSGLTNLGSSRAGQPTQPFGRGSAAFGRGFGRAGVGEISAAVRLGFKVQPLDVDQAVAATLRQVQNAGKIQTLGALDVSVKKGVAVLRGTVATPHDRLLAEQLVRLEPGVRQVRNELKIAPQQTGAESGSATPAPNP